MLHRMPWMAVVLMLAAACAGSEPPPAESAPVASNQAASLDEPGGGQEVPAAEPHVPELCQPPVENRRHTGEPAGDVRGAGGPRQTVARQRTTTVPWYRSGMVSLGVVLAAIAGVALLFRRLVPSVRSAAGGGIEVLARNHLSPKQTLALVRVGRRMVLVGVTPERMTSLCEIDDPQEVSELLGAASKKRPAATDAGFDLALSEAVAGYESPPAELAVPTVEASARLVEAKGRLHGLMARLKALGDGA